MHHNAQVYSQTKKGKNSPDRKIYTNPLSLLYSLYIHTMLEDRLYKLKKGIKGTNNNVCM